MKNIIIKSKIVFAGFATGLVLQLNWAREFLNNKGLIFCIVQNWLRMLLSGLILMFLFLLIYNLLRYFTIRKTISINLKKVENFLSSFSILFLYLFWIPSENFLVILFFIVPVIYYLLNHGLIQKIKDNYTYFKNIYSIFIVLLILQISKDIILCYYKNSFNYYDFTKQIFVIFPFLTTFIIFPNFYILFYVISITIYYISTFIFDTHILIYGTELPASAYYAIWETNTSEAIDYILQYFNLKVFLLFIILLVIVLLPLVLYRKSKNVDFDLRLLIATLILGISYLTGSYEEAIPLKFYNNFKKYKKDLNTVREQIEFRKNKLINQSNIYCNSRSDSLTFVLVIGESASKYHQGLYGYARNTNPLLETIKNELYIFDSVIAPHSHTNPAMEKILTFANHENMEYLYTKRTIIEYYKDAGFKTFWLSNQQFANFFTTIPTAIGKLANWYYFTFSDNSDDPEKEYYDELLFKPFEIALDDKANKKFIVLHLMGSHSPKAKRYPKQFEKFIDWNGIERKSFHTEWRKDLINSHDNSVLYTDYVLFNFIKKLKERNLYSVLLYFSDHGEELYDYRDFWGHAEGNASIYSMDIPFILWVSEKYKNKNKERIKDFPNYLKRKYQTDDVIHSIIDLTGCYSADFDSTRSIFSPHFIKRKRIIFNKDYDSLLLNNKLSVTD